MNPRSHIQTGQRRRASSSGIGSADNPVRPLQSCHGPSGACAGILLMECLVYLAMFFVVTGLAFAVLYRGWAANDSIRRSADDIAAAVRAGELWRADVRAANGPLREVAAEGAREWSIPQPRGTVTYRLAAGHWLRSTPERPISVALLKNVKSAEMRPDPRVAVTPWTLEVELKPTRKGARTRPLFTFIAVPAAPVP